jgi:gamma-glutamyltranspeptidase/glutathione hydrolase
LNQALGIAATGHAETSRTAAEILKAGGNAFDAAIGALAAACVAEPLMVSLAGGGFLLARAADGQALAYDFFCQTPARKRPEGEVDFFPIIANFGEDTQEFHMGMGAMAVPGCVAGMFKIHRDLGHMPMADILAPAINLARTGVRMDTLQHYIVRILQALLRADRTLFGLFESPSRPGELIGTGEILRNPAMAMHCAPGAFREELLYRATGPRNWSGTVPNAGAI